MDLSSEFEGGLNGLASARAEIKSLNAFWCVYAQTSAEFLQGLSCKHGAMDIGNLLRLSGNGLSHFSPSVPDVDADWTAAGVYVSLALGILDPDPLCAYSPWQGSIQTSMKNEALHL
jgi:hypothetical protein